MTNKYQSGQEKYEKPSEKTVTSGHAVVHAPVMAPEPAIEHPDYYNADGIEVVKVISAFGLNFNTGNCIKYVCRSGHKPGADRITDLRKAVFYLNLEIEELEKRRNRQNE